jgi:hypothetical protein
LRLGLDQAGAKPIVELEDVSRGETVQGATPSFLSEVDQEQLVLQAGEGELAVVVRAERMLVEILDVFSKGVLVVYLDREAALFGLLSTDHESPGDIAPVALEQPKGVAGRQPGLVGKGLQRVALR